MKFIRKRLRQLLLTWALKLDARSYGLDKEEITLLWQTLEEESVGKLAEKYFDSLTDSGYYEYLQNEVLPLTEFWERTDRDDQLLLAPMVFTLYRVLNRLGSAS